MKKLVKTAKQQFEERLSELTLIKKYDFIDTDLYYLCEDNSHEMSILREINDKEFYEQKYAMSYSELINSEEFLHEITMRFIEHHDEPVKPLFDWYASADKDNEPFTLDDIWMCSLENRDLSEVFSDLYEEVLDVRIITAREQWENDSKDANTLWENKDEILKVLITDEYVKFYRLDDAITCYTFPSLEKMRNDRWFVCQIVDTLSESCEHDKISPFIKWTRTGGDFPLPISIIFNSDYQDFTCHVYEDKELPQEQSIEEMIILTPEQKDAVQAFEKAARALKSAGVKIVSYYDENEFYAINGNAKLEFENIFDIDRDGFPNFKSISKTLMENHGINFTWDLYWGLDYDFCAKKL